MKALQVALIGYKFMGKIHSSALLECPFFFKNGVQPVRKVIVGRHEAPLQQAAADFGWEGYATDWRAVVNRPDIDVVDIATPPNTHGPGSPDRCAERIPASELEPESSGRGGVCRHSRSWTLE